MKLSVVIPAYNEEKRIGRTLDVYGDYLTGMLKKGLEDYEILVVINNTKDKTEEVVKSCQKKNKKIRYLNLVRGGKGYAIREGFEDALKREFDLVGFIDADMSTSAEAFYDLVVNIEKYDGAIASRYAPGAIVSPKQTFRRIVASRVFNFLVRILFFLHYRDTQCGAKIFRRNVLEKILPELGVTEWAIDVDLLYRAKVNRLKIIEVPTIWKDVGGSTLNLKKASTQMFFAVLQLRLKNSRLKRLIKPVQPFAGSVWKKIK